MAFKLRVENMEAREMPAVFPISPSDNPPATPPGSTPPPAQPAPSDPNYNPKTEPYPYPNW